MPSLDAPTLIEALVSRLQAAYILPDRAAEAGRLPRANLDAGPYASPVDEQLSAGSNGALAGNRTWLKSSRN